jgi:predicted glycoside hydrolase/deacetylase ChbG (UPF0249 family)
VPRLIVNADDFGLTSGVNRAIIELHQAGVLTSTTLMANAAASDESIELALANPTLGVGCHIVLVDGTPVLSPRQDVPNLANPVTGEFRSSLAEFLGWRYLKKNSPFQLSAAVEIEAEASAQIRLLQSRGLHLTHVDTHKHTHMFPAVLRPVLRAARACGITRIRNPFDSAWSRRTAASVPWLRRAQVAALSRLEAHTLGIIADHGFTTTDGTISVTITGSLNTESLCRTLACMPEGTWELVTHPGYHDADLDAVPTRLKASREIERQALTAIKGFPAIELTNFTGLDSTVLESHGTGAAVGS